MKILSDIECAIISEKNVLISGGDSTARTALARLIHARSSKRHESWVVLIDGAAGRTLFIEELTELDQRAQDDLMRLIERGVDPGLDEGGDTRIICSTAHDPMEHLRSKVFDTGLFYRLNTIHIALGDKPSPVSSTTH